MDDQVQNVSGGNNLFSASAELASTLWRISGTWLATGIGRAGAAVRSTEERLKTTESEMFRVATLTVMLNGAYQVPGPYGPYQEPGYPLPICSWQA